MPGKTAIEWATDSWNPVTGCTKVSAGCDHCYAETFAERFRGVPGHPYEQGFDLKLWPERLTVPLRWRKPRRVFVNSMSDLFHADVPDDFIAQVFAVMSLARRHTFQILTKRPQRMYRLMTAGGGDTAFAEEMGAAGWRLAPALADQDGAWPGWPLPNVWLGTSVENQAAAYRIDWLARTPAAVRFLSCEPLLGPLDLSAWLWHRTFLAEDPRGVTTGEIDWVIAGAESGHGARPMDEDWARALRDQCVAAGVPFFLKQFAKNGKKIPLPELDGVQWAQMPSK